MFSQRILRAEFACYFQLGWWTSPVCQIKKSSKRLVDGHLGGNGEHFKCLFLGFFHMQQKHTLKISGILKEDTSQHIPNIFWGAFSHLTQSTSILRLAMSMYVGYENQVRICTHFRFICQTQVLHKRRVTKPNSL